MATTTPFFTPPYRETQKTLRHAADPSGRKRRRESGKSESERIGSSDFFRSSQRLAALTSEDATKNQTKDKGFFSPHPPRTIEGVSPNQHRSWHGSRRHHLQVLTTILHQSLQRADYARAGRAWAMLLRAEVDGHSIDPRLARRWGMGAEILFQQGQELRPRLSPDGMEREESLGGIENPIIPMDPGGLKRVKDYYDALATYYPYSKIFTTAVGPLDFQYAALTMWIYCVVNKQAMVEQEAYIDISNHSEFANSGIRGEIVEEAFAIDHKLKDLLSTPIPPYMDSACYVNLQRTVQLWIEDLKAESNPASQDGRALPLENEERYDSSQTAASLT